MFAKPFEKQEHFTITLPGDLYETIEEFFDYAIIAAREEAETFVIPCQWVASHVSGEPGDYEIVFNVVRYSR